MSRLTHMLERIINQRWMQHLVFWLFSYVLLFRLMAYRQWPPAASDLVYIALFHVSLLAGVYLNLEVLIPRLLRPGRYLVYALGVSGVIALMIWLNLLTFRRLADWLVPGFYFITYYAWHQLIPFALAYLGTTTLLKLSKAWFREQENKRRLQQLEQEKQDAELRALRHQLNPHFLFNSLNNLFGLAQENDPRLAGLLLKLSQVMRYPLRESQGQLVPLQDELDYLADYIDLQRLRSEGQADIQFRVRGEIADQHIAPLLLLPFVENGFKHGVSGVARGAFVHIDLEVNGQNFIFNMRNSLGRSDQVERQDHTGIGLANVRRRLELLYPGRYRLEAGPEGKAYRVYLELELI